MLQYLNTVRLPLLPDIISDLMLLSTSRTEAERLCALEFLSSSCCTELPRNRQILLDNNLFRQVGKWLGASNPEERNFALQILLSTISADKETINKLVASTGAVRSILHALRKSINGDEEGLALVSECLRLLTHNARFVGSMFVKDVAGLPIILTALTSGTGGGGSVRVSGGGGGGSASKKPLLFDAAVGYVAGFSWCGATGCCGAVS